MVTDRTEERGRSRIVYYRCTGVRTYSIMRRSLHSTYLESVNFFKSLDYLIIFSYVADRKNKLAGHRLDNPDVPILLFDISTTDLTTKKKKLWLVR